MFCILWKISIYQRLLTLFFWNNISLTFFFAVGSIIVTTIMLLWNSIYIARQFLAIKVHVTVTPINWHPHCHFYLFIQIILGFLEYLKSKAHRNPSLFKVQTTSYYMISYIHSFNFCFVHFHSEFLLMTFQHFQTNS